MDIYTAAATNTYVLSITNLFMMPTDSGGIPAVAVSKKTSYYITSAYTILMILIFMIGWNLILAIIMAFWPTRREPNRQIVLVALWNSGESMNAMMLMAAYCKRVMFRMLKPYPDETASDLEAKGNENHRATLPQDLNGGSEDIRPVEGKSSGTPEGPSTSNGKCGVSNLLWGLLFVSVAMAMAVGNVVAGILVPAQLAMGNVAPPSKKAIFYPDVALYARTDDNGAAQAKLDSLKAPSALRALGSVEAADDDVSVRNRVHIDTTNSGGSAYLSYDYDVTGVDMGLQSDPTLRLLIKGACRTDDTWLVNSTDEGDTYKLFGGDGTYQVKYQPEVDLPPMVHFEIDPKSPKSNISYAMIVNTGGLYSYTAGRDPWYVTDKSENAAIAYQVRRGRPVLSCWEVTKWRLNGKEVDNSGLPTLPGLKLAKIWSHKVFPYEFGAPRIVSLGRAVGTGALKSASYAIAPSYILDAGASGILPDLERLVLASWVSSRNVVRDTTTYGSGSMVNLLSKGPGGSMEAGSAEFVLQSGDVVTLSVRVLIAVPAILLFLLIVHTLLNCALKRFEFGEPPIFGQEDKKPVKKPVKNAVALSATQIYGRLDQKINQNNNWEHTDLSVIPFVSSLPLKVSTTGTVLDEKSGTEATTTEKPVHNDQ